MKNTKKCEAAGCKSNAVVRASLVPKTDWAKRLKRTMLVCGEHGDKLLASTLQYPTTQLAFEIETL